MPRSKKVDMTLTLKERLEKLNFGQKVNEEYSSENMQFSDIIGETSYKLKELTPMIVDDVLSNVVSNICHKLDRRELRTISIEELDVLQTVFNEGVKRNLIKPLHKVVDTHPI